MRRLLICSLALAILPLGANASIIGAGNVLLGVNPEGHLNVGGGVLSVEGGTTDVGVRWVSPEGDQYESTSHGCLCEGWGISVGGIVGTAGVDNSPGVSNLTVDSFVFTASTATSVVTLGGTDVRITHDFGASASPDLMKVTVTIANTGATAVTDVIYRRAMDWDSSPTPFREYVTIQGTGTTTLLMNSSNNGFTNLNPTNPLGQIFPNCGLKVDFTACGPADHGAAFDFALGTIEAGESYTFEIFYGGAASRAAALVALGLVEAELYSFGWSFADADQDGVPDFDIGFARTPTFVFAFRGVGGDVIVPPPGVIPVPAAGWLLLTALGGLAVLRRRRHA